MRLFECQACGHWLSFEDTVCEGCGRTVGFIASQGRMRALDRGEDDVYHPFGDAGIDYRFCGNAVYRACNWLIAPDPSHTLCACCRTNHMVPDLSINLQAERWRQIEQAKHRLFYSLLRLDLPIPNKNDDPVNGLSFEILADTGDDRVMTGHEDGVITINIMEADNVERERTRATMQEPYRTLLGHFRHEIGHYYWDRLVRDGGLTGEFRAVFGDETIDYSEALQSYYGIGTPPDWAERFVSHYAASHAWEDFAETFAHYLHMIDTLESAYAFGLRIRPKARTEPSLDAKIDFDPYRGVDFATIVETWGPLTYAVNALNRSMGQPDLYPFKLVPSVIEKLAFIDRLVKGRAVQVRAA